MESPIDGGGFYCFDDGRMGASKIEVNTATLIANHMSFYVVVTYESHMHRVGLFCERTFWGPCCGIDSGFRCMLPETKVVEAVYRRLLPDYDSLTANPLWDSNEEFCRGSMLVYGIPRVWVFVVLPAVRIEISV